MICAGISRATIFWNRVIGSSDEYRFLRSLVQGVREGNGQFHFATANIRESRFLLIASAARTIAAHRLQCSKRCRLRRAECVPSAAGRRPARIPAPPLLPDRLKKVQMEE